MSFIELQSKLEFEWDVAKSDACLERRGFDFAHALRAFVDLHTVARSRSMSTVRMKADLERPATLPKGKIDRRKVDATTEDDLAVQQAEDDAETVQDAARYVRRVRRRLGLTQQEFARRIDVPIDTIRNWEQGKRYPTGAARSLLKVLDRLPKAALSALG